MGKTNRQTNPEKIENPHKGNPIPERIAEDEKRAADTIHLDLWYYSRHVAPEKWPSEILKELGKRASVKPWRTHHDGRGIADWGAVPGTQEEAHRYYFGALRGREEFRGTIVANSAKAVERWLRDSERASGYASRDPRHIANAP